MTRQIHDLRITMQLSDNGQALNQLLHVPLPNLPDDYLREAIRLEYREEVMELTRQLELAKAQSEYYSKQLDRQRSRNLWQRIKNT